MVGGFFNIQIMKNTVDKIELTERGVIVLRNEDDDIVKSLPNDCEGRIYNEGLPSEGVEILRNTKSMAILTASNITRIQIQPNPETPVSFTAQQLLEELTDSFFRGLVDSAAGLSNYLGVLASSPVSGAAGDYYYNSVTGEFVAYDDVRAKWLSVASHTYQFQRTGDVTNGTPLQDGSVVMSVSGATARGIRTGFDATIVGIAVNRSNTDFTATIDVFADNNTGSPLLQVSFSPATDTDAVNNAANVDITATNVLGVRVTGGATAKVSFPTGYLTVKRKY